ncbi:hypothetical protein BCR33DRAFT_314355 [Rhizoclosmatium globosum]|uniref:Uncharacterized protein n=1 Tax=Rhizoclosmatium globosum TaxID=329046 RepID=A0A1Y2CZ44_9FUNG|nr:hypothetical protein BCR33DRAFT_314355 [Rhizoclosmatium globosum]|eukprot:ORY52289.1 hypothetical protein BCR33DRAFT_314355 [Rhizoclosmatium globosum]
MATTLPLRYNRNLLALIILRVAVEATKNSFAKRTVPTRVAEFLNNLLIIPPLTDTLRSIFHVPDFFEVEMMRYRGLKRDYEGIFGGVGCLESAEVRGEELAKVLLNAGMEIMLVGNRPKYEKYIGELYGPVITRMQQLRKQHLAAKKSNSPSPAVIAPARPMPTKSSSPSSPAVVSNAQLSSSTSSKPVTNSQLPRSSSSIHSLPPKPVVPSPSIPIPTSSTQQSSGDNRFHPYAKPPSSSYSNSNYSSQQRPSSSGSSYKSNGSSDRYSNQRDRDSHYRGPPPPSSTSTGATYQKPGNPPPVPPLPGWYPPQSQPHGRNPVVPPPPLPHHAFVPPLPGGPLPPAPPPPPL